MAKAYKLLITLLLVFTVAGGGATNAFTPIESKSLVFNSIHLSSIQYHL
ncbi:hypothetical protein [Thermotalea metallivorans]|nr:hypothetical protein [Thermotalea metallivorans]